MNPKKEAISIIKEFTDIGVDEKTAIECALVLSRKMLSSIGADRGYSFWVSINDCLLEIKRKNNDQKSN